MPPSNRLSKSPGAVLMVPELGNIASMLDQENGRRMRLIRRRTYLNIEGVKQSLEMMRRSLVKPV